MSKNNGISKKAAKRADKKKLNNGGEKELPVAAESIEAASTSEIVLKTVKSGKNKKEKKIGKKNGKKCLTSESTDLTSQKAIAKPKKGKKKLARLAQAAIEKPAHAPVM